MRTSGEPIEATSFQYGIQRRSLVCPIQELLANPASVLAFRAALHVEHTTSHAKSAKGLLLKTNPIVLGRVPCSRAYADPDAFQISPRLTPSCSTEDKDESSFAEAGRPIGQKFRCTAVVMLET